MTTKTKERPIIFSGDSLLAIIDGRKTQTRRVVKPQPWQNEVGQWLWEQRPELQIPFHPELDEQHYPGTKLQHCCPYGKAPDHLWEGDLLWVRETWACIWTEYEPGEGQTNWDVPHRIEYKADSGAKYPGQWPDDSGNDPECPRWSSPIHMFRRASRILLEIASVRVERVQEISEIGAFEEGCTGEGYSLTAESFSLARQEFEHLWDSINAKRGFGWDVNPWVWVIEFKIAA